MPRRPARAEIWLPIYPDNVGTDTLKAATGQSAAMWRGAGVDFRLGFFDSPAQGSSPAVLRDVSNILTVRLTVRTVQGGGTLLMDKTINQTAIDPTLTIADWNAKAKSHCTISFLGSETLVTAAKQYLAIFGSTSDDSTDSDGFGAGRIDIIDIGIAGADSPPPPGPTYATMDILAAALLQKVSYGKNPAGKTITLVSPGAAFGRTIGCDDNGNPIDAEEDY